MRTSDRRATLAALIAALITVSLIFIGSRGFRDFDSALIAYAVATLFAIAALTYRYTLWLSRPPTARYFRAGWTEFLSWRNFRRYTLLIPRAWWTDIFAQTFIRHRSRSRWIAHLCIFWGVVLSLAVTVPLSFGWVRFTLVEPDRYRAWFFGLPIVTFPIDAGSGFAIFHILDFTAVLLIVGLALALWRRLHDAGLLATLPPAERFHWLTAPRSTIIQTSPVHAGRAADPARAMEELLDRLVRPTPSSQE